VQESAICFVFLFFFNLLAAIGIAAHDNSTFNLFLACFMILYCLPLSIWMASEEIFNVLMNKSEN